MPKVFGVLGLKIQDFGSSVQSSRFGIPGLDYLEGISVTSLS